MFRCVDCGAIFEEPKIIKDYRGEFWGVPCYEDVECCPRCCGDFEDFEDDEEDEI